MLEGPVVADFVRFDVEQDLGPALDHVVEHRRDSNHLLLGSANGNDVLVRHNSGEAYLKYVAQDVGDVIQVADRGYVADIKSLQRHALILLAHLLRVIGNDYLIAGYRRPERLGDFSRQTHGRVEVKAIHIKADLAA